MDNAEFNSFSYDETGNSSITLIHILNLRRFEKVMAALAITDRFLETDTGEKLIVDIDLIPEFLGCVITVFSGTLLKADSRWTNMISHLADGVVFDTFEKYNVLSLIFKDILIPVSCKEE